MSNFIKNLSTWVARGAFACLAIVSSYAAVLSQGLPVKPLPVVPQVVIQPQLSDDALRERVVQLGDRLANIEGKLDVMEKLDIGLIIAMGGQLLHLALAKKGR